MVSHSRARDPRGVAYGRDSRSSRWATKPVTSQLTLVMKSVEASVLLRCSRNSRPVGTRLTVTIFLSMLRCGASWRIAKWIARWSAQAQACRDDIYNGHSPPAPRRRLRKQQRTRKAPAAALQARPGPARRPLGTLHDRRCRALCDSAGAARASQRRGGRKAATKQRERRAPLLPKLALGQPPARLTARQLLLRRLRAQRRQPRLRRGQKKQFGPETRRQRARGSRGQKRAFSRLVLLRSCARSAFSLTSASAAARPRRVSPTSASSASQTVVSLASKANAA
jgi:hypothetical protein